MAAETVLLTVSSHVIQFLDRAYPPVNAPRSDFLQLSSHVLLGVAKQSSMYDNAMTTNLCSCSGPKATVPRLSSLYLTG